ncbi:hypothetical protein DM01DRAFT_1327449, partial [Hesseltinella vesiculosa]
MKVTTALCVAGLLTTLVQGAPVHVKETASATPSVHGKFLHITDIHLDTHYLAGSDPNELCHRKTKSSKNTAGKFGTLSSQCDSPVSLVEASFGFMKSNIADVDFILYTGDTARHDRDNKLARTSKDVVQDHKQVIQYFQNTYDLTKVKLIPTIGNNDMFDHNTLTENDSMYGTLEEIWAPLGLNLTNDWRKGGYFVQNINDKLRVINTNSMFFFNKNDNVDDCVSGSPGQIQMQWIQQQLTAARNAKAQVYIIGHVPPNDDDGSLLFKNECHSQYLNLLGQFGDVVSGHFTGHTNDDVLTAVVPNGKSVIAMPDESPKSLSQVSTVLFNAPSIIPVNNPAIRVYNYETSANAKGSAYGSILDWTQYYADLEKANAAGKLNYELEYVASQLFSVKNFNDVGVKQAFSNLNTNSTARQLYSKVVKVS